MPGAPLRRRLFVLTAAGILPLAVAAGVGLLALAQHQRTQAERVGLELTRSVATAIDAELRSSLLVLEAIATTPTLDTDDLSAFRARALRLVAVEREWAALALADAGGMPLVDTRFAEGAVLPAIADPDSFGRVVRTREPVVGDLARNARGAWLFAVRVPVVRDGELRYVLTALVEPAKIRGVLTRQRVPGNWVISVVDRKGQRVARSRAHEETLGGRLSESVQAIAAREAVEGSGVAYTLEGVRIFAPYSRLTPAGWTVVMGIPTAEVEAAAYRSLAFYGSGVLLSIAFATLAALWVARSINRPIADLRTAAEALGRGAQPRAPSTSIQEIRAVAAALSSAAEQLKLAEAERNDLLRKERAARQTAETADQAKEEFLAVLSHELRTPLNAVYGWARLLQGGELRDEALVTRAMDAIVRNSDVQVQLIDDLLDLSRITSGKMRLDVRRVDLEDVVQAALDVVRPAADAKALQLETVVNGPRPGLVTGDPSRLQQVVWNLLSNAVKFTPRGGRVELLLRRVSSQVEIVISDTGQGIAPEMLPHVFERFRQADSSSTRKHGGLGLGLALVKHLVDLHGGDVVAHSPGKGKGATFTVTLPISAAEIPAGSAGRPSPSASSANIEPLPAVVRLDDLRVLVVDDDEDAVRLAEAILLGAGAQVQSCLTAAEALALLRQWRPDVLVSDIEMPVEDGYSLIRKVRALAAEQGGHTPAIALTAYGRAQDRQRTLAAGYSMHVPKPVDPGELTAIIASVVGRPTA